MDSNIFISQVLMFNYGLSDDYVRFFSLVSFFFHVHEACFLSLFCLLVNAHAS